MINLFEIKGSELVPIQRKKLPTEEMLEDWISKNPRLIGLDVLVLGRQIQTEGGPLDILAIDSDGDLVIVELKRDRTPRDIVAQVLDYASWVRGLTTKQVYEIATVKLGSQLAAAFSERFGTELPENLNGDQSMIIVASEFDASSKRIVEYLNEAHGVNINANFFNVFEQDGKLMLATDWLMPQEQVTERSERKTKAPWSGLWYVNVGDGPNRSWEDMRRYRFWGAGSDPVYSDPLRRLHVNDQLYAYQKGAGYVGHGRVVASVIPAKEFHANGRPLFEQKLEQENLKHDANDADKAEYVVGIDWIKTFPLNQAKKFPGAFSNPNIVCKLRDPKTIEFLNREFGIDPGKESS